MELGFFVYHYIARKPKYPKYGQNILPKHL